MPTMRSALLVIAVAGSTDGCLSACMLIRTVGIPRRTLKEIEIERLSKERKYRKNREVNQRQSKESLYFFL